jgi:hypothetical protein
MQSISKKIIYGSDDDLVYALQHGPDLNVIDEYGYTPLVQTAIVNSVNKARLLLHAGAQIDFPDLTNRTALNWAASNNNYDLCELLLQNGANPNSYTTAGQCVLVTPLLRKQKRLTDLLFKHGANLDFAEDFINAKLLGHRYELEGRVDIVDTEGTFIEVELEGFYLEFSLEVVASSLMDFRQNFGAKHLRPYFRNLDVIIKSLQGAIQLIKFQHYLIDIEKHKRKIEKLLDYQPLILPVAFTGHAITLVRFWDWLMRCDRGEFGRKHGTTVLYFMNNAFALNKSFMTQLLYKRQYAESVNTALPDVLNLEQIWNLPLSEQRVGNCSWANVEALIPAIMFLLLLDARNGKNPEACEKDAMYFYNEWVEWDKNRALQFCLQTVVEASRARKAAKAALLAAIMFQACDYNSKNDREKVRSMLQIITMPEYKYIVESYIEVFSERGKKSVRLQNLYDFLDDFGVLREFVKE